MKKEIIQDIKDNLIHQLLVKYKIKESKEIGGYQNFIYEIHKDHKSYILRITHANHRKKKEIEAELVFLNYLAVNQVNVTKAVKLPYCYLVETFKTDNHKYYVTILDKAEGLNWINHKSDHETYYLAGKELGKIHQLSKNMKNKLHRTSWYDNQYIKDAYQVIENKTIILKLEKLLNKLHHLPRTKDTYGLIHGDYHFANLIYMTNSLTVIDFDEAEYHWFIYDIAVYLFYYILGGDPAHMDIEPNIELFKTFMRGYLSENSMSEYSIKQLPLFFRLREFILLSSIYRSTNGDITSPWQKAYVDKAEYRIINNLPFIDIDFVSLFNDISKNRKDI